MTGYGLYFFTFGTGFTVNTEIESVIFFVYCDIQTVYIIMLFGIQDKPELGSYLFREFSCFLFTLNNKVV